MKPQENDKPHGLVEKKGSDGHLWFSGNYVNGVEDGLHQHFDYKGRLAKSTNYKDGKALSNTKLKIVGYGGRDGRGHHNRFHYYQEHYIGDKLMVTFDKNDNSKLTQYGLQSLEYLVENNMVSLNITDRSDVGFKNKVGNLFSNVTDIEYAKQVYANTMGEGVWDSTYSHAIKKYEAGVKHPAQLSEDESWHAAMAPKDEPPSENAPTIHSDTEKFMNALTYIEAETQEFTPEELTPESGKLDAGIVLSEVEEKAKEAKLKSRRANASTTTNTDAPAIGPE
jgi:hypothetical protein